MEILGRVVVGQEWVATVMLGKVFAICWAVWVCFLFPLGVP